jgi:hypothetical protein
MDDDRDRAEMRALCDQFRELMAREVDQQLFDSVTCVRIGEIIGSTTRQGGSEFGYLRRRA